MVHSRMRFMAFVEVLIARGFAKAPAASSIGMSSGWSAPRLITAASTAAEIKS